MKIFSRKLTTDTKGVPRITLKRDFIFENGYAYFGEYQQSVVSDESLILELLKLTNEIDTYVEFEDFCYYCTRAVPSSEERFFSNGTKVIDDKIYYFKVEPIKWIATSNSENMCTLLSCDVLDIIVEPHRFMKEVENYLLAEKYFYEQAFNAYEKERIVPISFYLKEKTESTPLIVKSNVNIPSINEKGVLKCFDNENKEMIYRKAKPSDYVVASSLCASVNNTMSWLVRENDSSKLSIIDSFGQVEKEQTKGSYKVSGLRLEIKIKV